MQDSSDSTDNDLINGLIFQDPQYLPGLELRPRNSSAATSCRTLLLHHGIGDVSHMAKLLGGRHAQLTTDLGCIHSTPVLYSDRGHFGRQRQRRSHAERNTPVKGLWEKLATVRTRMSNSWATCQSCQFFEEFVIVGVRF